MTYDARQVANWFVERASKDGKSLSIMSLLKLVYFAHGWNLAFSKAPLFSNKIEAWQYGPVVPDVYRDFRGQGVNVSKPLPSYLGGLSESTVGLLDEVYRVYGKLPAFQLSDLTHVRGGPWHVAWEIDGWYTPIPDDLIEQHFELQRLRLQEKKKAESLNA